MNIKRGKVLVKAFLMRNLATPHLFGSFIVERKTIKQIERMIDFCK